jgi:hypothetical protein
MKYRGSKSQDARKEAYRAGKDLRTCQPMKKMLKYTRGCDACNPNSLTNTE